MQTFYKISKKVKKDGNHRLHTIACKKTLDNQKKYYTMPNLFDNSFDALEVAWEKFTHVKPCKHCCQDFYN